MTNLFFNDSRTIAMDNRQQINSRLDNMYKAEILGKIKSVFFLHYEQAVDDCCKRIDFEFSLQLGKNREKLGKDQYIKLLEYLRSVRRELKQNYLLKVTDIFDGTYQKAANNQRELVDFSKVSLINDDVVKENNVIAAIIRQCEHLFYEELAMLNKLLANQQSKQTIADSQNPIFPEKLIRAMVEVVKPLKLNTDSRIALYKSFEVSVFSQLGFIYRELIKGCEADTIGCGSSEARSSAMESRAVAAKSGPEARFKPLAVGFLDDLSGFTELDHYWDLRNGASSSTQLHAVDVIKEEIDSDAVNEEQSSMEFRLLQKKLELWRLAHSPSACDLVPVVGSTFYEQFEIINALQVLQQFNDDLDPDEKMQPLKWRVLKKLEELSFNVDVKNLDKQDEDVLDLVALIFSGIARDELLQDTVKKALLRLEIPLSAVSLRHCGIFTSRDNPVRQFLDDLFAAGMFLNVDEYDDRLIQDRIVSAVKRMTKDSGFEFSGWIVEAREVSNYLSKQKQRTQKIEENAKQFMINKQALEANRKAVAIVIENSLDGKTLPTAIIEFLRNVWSDVLQAAYVDKIEQPEQWKKSVQTMDELIISVIPPTDANERKQILRFLPGLIAELRSGLKRISYEKSAQSRFFKDLAVWHIILMDNKEAKKTLIDVVKDNAALVEDEKIKTEGEEIADDSLGLAKNIAEESWVGFATESGRQWAKLLWKDTGGRATHGAVAETENMLFVGKNGAKMFEMQTNELAEKLRSGQAAIIKIDEKTITERVLSELMGL